MEKSTQIKFETPDQGEETARADLYGLLAALFYTPPSPELLQTLRSSAVTGEGVLGQAWTDMVNMANQLDAQTISDEYAQLFIGTGKPEILLYGSYYLSGFLMEKPLAVLRSDLQQLGLQRADQVMETEDHIASLCEVMRYLIASEDILQANLGTQKQFFSTHLQSWAGDLCGTIIVHPQARFYAALAQLTKTFLEVEAQSFDME
ncbi:TorD/DmsD family molecular chaperone [Undibacterium oligocarboniphilum]|uniref:Molecular chaperone n=1 Tax=Undibacterium oligocarboniphilum TaxID=666702 RepID=A0A850QML3_9BURK|nr:molecular chaperone [Undibacterium oligocarboniphilum]MBC3871367.1 molecular chaperone [Undibacterium oligocarboniphilum]NVO78865.1 molecular chaperone [Undibacterium oligocarboniphilum]